MHTPGRGPDRAVAGATIWERSRPPARSRLILVTIPRLGREEAADLIADATAADAAAVVVRSGCLPVGAGADAVAAGVPVLVLADRVSWEELGDLVRSLAAASRVGVPTDTSATRGLYELAESVAPAVGGTVLITDAELRVLAFAGARRDDSLAVETILSRRAPRVLRTALEPVRNRRGASQVEVPGAGAWWIAPVLQQQVVVGFVALIPPPGTPAVPDGVLAELVVAAAAWFDGEPVGGDDEDVVRSELLHVLLAGAGTPDALAERLGEHGNRWCLLAFGTHADAAVPLAAGSERMLARSVRMVCPGSATTVIDGVAYVLFRHPAGGNPERLAEQLRRRCSVVTGDPVVACVGELSEHPAIEDELGLLRHGVSVLAARPAPSTARLAAVRPHAVLAELGRLAAQHPGLLSGTVTALRRDSTPRGDEYLNTLIGWFDTGCDVSRAAALLRVHRNTLRYRLQRIQQVFDVDLDDPVQRFVLELQLRLLAVTECR